MKKFLLVLSLIIFIVSASSLVTAQTVLSGCDMHILNLEGEEYVLEEDMTDCSIDSPGSNLFVLGANDVTLDCQGHTVSGIYQSGDSLAYAMYASGSYYGFQVQNCAFTNFYSAGYFNQLEDINFVNNYFENTFNALVFGEQQLGTVSFKANRFLTQFGSAVVLNSPDTSVNFNGDNVLCNSDNVDLVCSEGQAPLNFVRDSPDYFDFMTPTCNLESFPRCSEAPAELFFELNPMEFPLCQDLNSDGIYEDCGESRCSLLAHTAYLGGICYSFEYLDFTGDGRIGIDDSVSYIQFLRDHFQQTVESGFEQFDLQDDGFIDWSDVKLFVKLRALLR